LLLFRIHGHPPQWAVKAMNRAAADNQSAQSEEEGLEPTKEWVRDRVLAPSRMARSLVRIPSGPF
jgi:hypothetical protein